MLLALLLAASGHPPLPVYGVGLVGPDGGIECVVYADGGNVVSTCPINGSSGGSSGGGGGPVYGTDGGFAASNFVCAPGTSCCFVLPGGETICSDGTGDTVISSPDGGILYAKGGVVTDGGVTAAWFDAVTGCYGFAGNSVEYCPGVSSQQAYFQSTDGGWGVEVGNFSNTSGQCPGVAISALGGVLAPSDLFICGQNTWGGPNQIVLWATPDGGVAGQPNGSAVWLGTGGQEFTGPLTLTADPDGGNANSCTLGTDGGTFDSTCCLQLPNGEDCGGSSTLPDSGITAYANLLLPVGGLANGNITYQLVRSDAGVCAAPNPVAPCICGSASPYAYGCPDGGLAGTLLDNPYDHCSGNVMGVANDGGAISQVYTSSFTVSVTASDWDGGGGNLVWVGLTNNTGASLAAGNTNALVGVTCFSGAPGVLQGPPGPAGGSASYKPEAVFAYTPIGCSALVNSGTPYDYVFLTPAGGATETAAVSSTNGGNVALGTYELVTTDGTNFCTFHCPCGTLNPVQGACTLDADAGAGCTWAGNTVLITEVVSCYAFCGNIISFQTYGVY